MGYVVEFEDNDTFQIGKVIFVIESNLKWEVIESYSVTLVIRRLDNGDIKRVSRRNLDYFLLCGKIEVI